MHSSNKIAIYSKEYGGGLKGLFCLGSHVWGSKMAIEQKFGTLKHGRKHYKFVLNECIHCGRTWIYVLRWMEWK